MIQAESKKSKSLLIIDDNEDICIAVSDILGEVGITVVTATDGQEGLDRFLEYQDSVGIVLLDLGLPVVHGTEVLKRLRSWSPTLPIIISSGYGDTVLNGQPPDPHLSFLSKPFSFDDLVTKVEAAVQ